MLEFAKTDGCSLELAKTDGCLSSALGIDAVDGCMRLISIGGCARTNGLLEFAITDEWLLFDLGPDTVGGWIRLVTIGDSMQNMCCRLEFAKTDGWSLFELGMDTIDGCMRLVTTDKSVSIFLLEYLHVVWGLDGVETKGSFWLWSLYSSSRHTLHNNSA